jgi:hypothetical protein
MIIDPPLTPLAEVDQVLADQGYAVLSAESLGLAMACQAADLAPWAAYWENLPADGYLRDGGRYRRRRHSCFVVDGGRVSPVAQRAHWQPLAYNALHGGIERHFEAIEPGLLAQPLWHRLLLTLAARASALKGAQPWFVEAHPFRIDTTDGIGRPTPEGAHRDGVDLVSVTLVSRVGVKGAETRVFEADGALGRRFTLVQPWSTLLLDDARVVHESTPIQPLDAAAGGHRDTLVLTFRSGGFQGLTAD